MRGKQKFLERSFMKIHWHNLSPCSENELFILSALQWYRKPSFNNWIPSKPYCNDISLDKSGCRWYIISLSRQFHWPAWDNANSANYICYRTNVGARPFPWTKNYTFWYMSPKKTQISQCIRVVDQSSLSAWRNFTSWLFQNAPSKDSDKTTRTGRLIWILAVRTCPTVRFLALHTEFKHYLTVTLTNLCHLYPHISVWIEVNARDIYKSDKQTRAIAKVWL